jgi:transposase
MKRLLTLTDDARTEILRRYKTEKNVRFRERLHGLLLKAQGYSNQEVARLLHVRRETIGDWLTRYEDGGLDALCHLEAGGSEGFLSAEQTGKLRAELDQHQFQCAKEVAAWVEEQFGITYSERGMRDLLQRLGYSSQKVHLVPAQADVEAQAAFLKGA